MTAAQLSEIEREAREILTGAAKLNRKYMKLLTRARGERPAPRICTCRPCLRMWGLRGLAVVLIAADLLIAHLAGVI